MQNETKNLICKHDLALPFLLTNLVAKHVLSQNTLHPQYRIQCCSRFLTSFNRDRGPGPPLLDPLLVLAINQVTVTHNFKAHLDNSIRILW